MPNKFNKEWTDVELTAAIDAYLEMLSCEQNGKLFNKAEINRELRAPGAPLEGRTKASIEYRMQNISAVLMVEKKTVVKGYAPAANVGDHIRTRITRILKERQKSAD